MLGRHVGLVALVALGAAGLVAVGCGSDDPAPGTGNTGTSGTGGSTAGGGSGGSTSGGGQAGSGGSGQAGDTGSGGADTEPPCDAACLEKYTSKPGEGTAPDKPAAAPAGDGTAPTYFAVNRLFVGDTDFEGSPSATAWKDIGFNIDGFTSDKNFSGQCQALSKQAKTDIRTDGNNGIDNAFGNIIISQGTLPIENASQAATGAIEEGSFSLVLKFDDLGTAGDYSAVSAQVIPVGMKEGVVPKFDKTDSWSPFDPTDSPPIDFKGGWVNKNTWVSGSKGTLPLSLEISGIKITLAIQQAQISATMNDDHTEIVKGIIGGSLNTEALITNLKAVAGNLNLCGAAFDSVAEQIKQASDSLTAGGQDASVKCDSISIGIGFKGKVTGAPGAPLPKAVPKPDPCAGQLASPVARRSPKDPTRPAFSRFQANEAPAAVIFLAPIPLPHRRRFAYLHEHPLARSLQNDERSSQDLPSRPRHRTFRCDGHHVDVHRSSLRW